VEGEQGRNNMDVSMSEAPGDGGMMIPILVPMTSQGVRILNAMSREQIMMGS
jgi:hypothetical protein